MDKKIEDLASFLKKGSKIHIKKSQRGSFTSYCGGKVTNECIQRGKNSPDPRIRKKATFAANARTWKHSDGGILKYVQGGTNNTSSTLVYEPFVQDFNFDTSSTSNFPVEPVRTYYFANNAEQTTVPGETTTAITPEIDTSYRPSSKNSNTEIEEPVSAIVTKSKYSKGEQSKFVKDMYTLYSKELSKRGLPTEYAKWLTAQDALETGWGKSIIGNNNFGNIQYFDEIHGNKYSFTGGTDKHADGTKYSARFVNFNNIEDYIKYKVGMLSNPNSKRYRNIFIGDINGFADRMQASGYAESKTYGKALKDVFNTVGKYLK